MATKMNRESKITTIGTVAIVAVFVLLTIAAIEFGWLDAA